MGAVCPSDAGERARYGPGFDGTRSAIPDDECGAKHAILPADRRGAHKAPGKTGPGFREAIPGHARPAEAASRPGFSRQCAKARPTGSAGRRKWLKAGYVDLM